MRAPAVAPVRSEAPRSTAPTPLSPNLQGISGSETLRISGLAAELRARGRSVVSLGAGEPDFDTPAHIRAAAAAAIEAGHTRYTPVAGIPALRKAIAEKLKRDNRVAYDPEEVIVSAGAKQVLLNACIALFGPGDEVLLPAPYWVSFPAMIRLARAEPAVIATTAATGYKVTSEMLRRALTRRTRGLVLNSPSNPTGAVYDADELEAIAEVCVEHGLWILSDEIYERLCYDRAAAPSIAAATPAARERTVTVNGFSKTYAMTGWRVGYGAAPRAVVDAMSIVQSHSTSNASSVGQHAALAALVEREASDAALEEMRSAFRRRRARLLSALHELPGVASQPPDGAFYVLSDVSELLANRGRSGGNADEFCMRLLEERGLALVAGDAFGAPGHVRWSFAAAEGEILEGVARFRAAVLEQESGGAGGGP